MECINDVPVLQALLVLLAGLVTLVGGGEVLVDGAARLARRMGLSPLVIGLTVIAFGTSLPELFVSLTASLAGHPEIMIGNVVGSNIANVGLILGLSSLVAVLGLTIREVFIELLLVIGGSVLLTGMSARGSFTRPLGLLFVATLIGYTYFIYTSSHDRVASDAAKAAGPAFRDHLGMICLQVVVGLVFLAAGSSWFLEGAVNLARAFGVSELIIGLTLTAVGTSLPELASSLSALRRGQGGMLIGNVIGSNMFNLFMVLGCAGLVRPFSLSPALLHRDLPVMLAFSLVLVPLLLRERGISRIHGLLLLGGYGLYCWSLLGHVSLP